MIAECGTRRTVEVDRAEKIVQEKKLPVPPPPAKPHNQFRGVRKSKRE